MWRAVIWETAGAVEGMTEGSSLVENTGIPNSVRHPGNT